MRDRRRTGSVLSPLALLAFVGCGNNAPDMANPFDFHGTWNGTLSSNRAPCSDGSFVPAGSTQVSVMIISTGNSQLVAHAPCGDLVFTQFANVATQSRNVTCPPMITPTSQVTQTIHDASLALNVNALQVDLVSDFAVAANGMTSFCKDIPATGVLIRTTADGSMRP